MTPAEAQWVREHALTKRVIASLCGDGTALLGLCACQWGRVFYCTIGQHGKCSDTVRPDFHDRPARETHILRRNGSAIAAAPVYLAVPCRYRCPCDCHQQPRQPRAVQPALFELAGSPA